MERLEVVALVAMSKLKTRSRFLVQALLKFPHDGSACLAAQIMDEAFDEVPRLQFGPVLLVVLFPGTHFLYN